MSDVACKDRDREDDAESAAFQFVALRDTSNPAFCELCEFCGYCNHSVANRVIDGMYFEWQFVHTA